MDVIENLAAGIEIDPALGMGEWCTGPASEEAEALTYRVLLCAETQERLNWWAKLSPEERQAEVDETERTGRWGATDGVDLILRHALAGKAIGSIAMSVQKTKGYVRQVLEEHGITGRER